MRRPILLTLAAVIAASSTVATLAPAGAAAKAPTDAPAAASGIELVRDRHWDNNRWNNNNRWDNDNDWDHHHRHRHHRPTFFPQLFFQFPYAFAPRTQYRHDCFRGGDGRLYCAR